MTKQPQIYSEQSIVLDNATAIEQMLRKIAEQNTAFNLVFDQPIRCKLNDDTALLTTIELADPVNAYTVNVLNPGDEYCWFFAVADNLEADSSTADAAYMLHNMHEALQSGSYKLNQQISDAEVAVRTAYFDDKQRELVDIFYSLCGGDKQMETRMKQARKVLKDFNFSDQYIAVELLAEDVWNDIIDSEEVQTAIEEARSVWNNKYDELVKGKTVDYELNEEEDEQLAIAEDKGRNQISDALYLIVTDQFGYDFDGDQWSILMGTRHFEELIGMLYM